MGPIELVWEEVGEGALLRRNKATFPVLAGAESV